MDILETNFYIGSEDNMASYLRNQYKNSQNRFLVRT